MEAGIRPIGDSLYMAVLDRVPVDVIDMLGVILFFIMAILGIGQLAIMRNKDD